eukprot:TRINITY_DN5327_c0_g1_i1.p2 TRINITY_DN5327_c0_g1~~TRINITY_DN5327_c0_g1_i1.p2  ORF type:complete len:430 (-),score=130.61 TRINITY_DN5327_c0_g1_i1:75-1364(-)
MQLTRLPPLVLTRVLSHLVESRDLAAASATCAALRAVCTRDNAALWRKLCMRRWRDEWRRGGSGACRANLVPCPSRLRVASGWDAYFRAKWQLGVRGVLRSVPDAHLALSPRFKHTATVCGRSVVFIGGQRSHDVRYSDVAVFDPDTMTFAYPCINGSPPRFARHTACLCAGGRKIVVFGGFDGIDTYFGTAVLDLPAMSWEYVETKGVKPRNRTNHACCAIGKQMFVFGGISGKNLDDLGDFLVLDTETMTWSAVDAPGVPPARCGHVMFTANGNVYVFGGGAEEGWKRKFSELHVYDPRANRWSIQPCTVCGEGGPARVSTLIFPYFFQTGPFVFLYGGICPNEGDEILVNDLFVLDTVSFSWRLVTVEDAHLRWRSVESDAKAMGTASVVGDRVIIFGGTDTHIRPLRHMELLQLPPQFLTFSEAS